MSCKECLHYVACKPQWFYCGFYNCDFIYRVDDDLENVCSHFEGNE